MNLWHALLFIWHAYHDGRLVMQTGSSVSECQQLDDAMAEVGKYLKPKNERR